MNAPRPDMPLRNPIVEEVRRIRAELSARFDNDVRKLAEHARTFEAKHAAGIAAGPKPRRPSKPAHRGT